MRILDCKKDSDKPFMQDAPRVTDSLCEECREHFEKVKAYLTEAGIEYKLDPNLVRGSIITPRPPLR